MTVVVVYESMYGNTHRIAEAISQGLLEAGAPAEVLSIEAVRERGLHPEEEARARRWGAELAATIRSVRP